MISKIAHVWDKDFAYKEDIEIFPDENEEYVLPENATFESLPEPVWKPVFDTKNGIWIETITDEELEEIQKPPVVTLPDTVILGQQMTEREIEAMEQGQKITDLEIQAMEQGQMSTDMELRLLALEVKADV